MAQFAHDSYILPASYDSVPMAWKSNSAAKPLPSSIQTVNVPALTSNASASGTSIIQLPCGSSAGIMMNPYIRLDMTLGGTTDASTTFMFKGVAKCATSLLNRYSTYINSVQVDNIQNADAVYDTIFSHATSYDWLTHDAQCLMGAPVRNIDGLAAPDAAASTVNGGALALKTYIIPLIGALGTQQGVPLFALNGTLQVQLDYNSVARALVSAVGGVPTAFTISNVQLVYDRVSVEQAFVDKVRSDMAAGAKYVLAYTNFQSTSQASAAGTGFLNYGLNVSSLKAIVAQQMLTTDLADVTLSGLSLVNGLTQFQVSLDGRLVNSNTLNAVVSPALVFAELNKCFSRLFDASITDVSTRANYSGNAATTSSSFAVGVSAQRCGEALAFSGSPVSILGLNFSTTLATHTLFITFISDYQLLIDSSGAVEIVR